MFDGENVSFDASLDIYTNSINIPPIMFINRIYENQKPSVAVACFLPGWAKDLSTTLCVYICMYVYIYYIYILYIYIYIYIYRGAGKSLARPTSRCILFDGENISFDVSLVLYIYIYIYY